MRRGIFVLVIVWLAMAHNAATAQDTLKVIDPSTLVVEPGCNTTGSATGTLIFRNDGTKKMAIHLSSDGISSKTPARQLPILPVFVPKADQLDGDGQLDPGRELTVQATINNLHDDGDWAAAIQNDKVTLGSLRILKTTPRFSITVDSAVPDQPELIFVRGEPGFFRLKNADPQQYDIAWEYSVDGHVVRSTDPVVVPSSQNPSLWSRLVGKKDIDPAAKSVQCGGGMLTVPAAGEQEVHFAPPADWFGNGFAGLFKDQTADGRLVVGLVDSRCPCQPTVSRSFKIKTHLATSSGPWREALADFWVFVVLGIGGVFSLGLNLLLPNQIRRLKMKRQLSQLNSQISNLPYDLASRLRVLVGLECRLIKDRLRNLTWNSPDFTGEMQGLDQAIDRLETRLQFLDGLGATRTNFQQMRSEVLPPSLMFSIEQVFSKIVQIGEKSEPSDEDVKTAQSLITNIQNQLDLGIFNNSDFATGLASKVTQYKLEFDPEKGRIGKTATCKRIRQQVPGPFDRLDATDETKIVPAADALSVQNYIELDRDLFDLEMIRQYVDLVEGMAPDEEFRKQIESHEPELKGHLEKPNCEDKYALQLLLKQMKEGYFKGDIQSEIEAKRLRIKVDHIDLRRYQPCEFRLQFLKLPLNDASARQEWTCRWTFSDPDGQVLIEDGWVVTHYFQRAIEYGLNIDLAHKDGTTIPVPPVEPFPEGKIKVLEVRTQRSLSRAAKSILRLRWKDAAKEWRKGQQKSGRALDYVRLAMALVIALIGLMAGAKEQLLKLDVVPALLAIFLVGFGADQIKNLLTQKPPGADSTPTPKG